MGLCFRPTLADRNIAQQLDAFNAALLEQRLERLAIHTPDNMRVTRNAARRNPAAATPTTDSPKKAPKAAQPRRHQAATPPPAYEAQTPASQLAINMQAMTLETVFEAGNGVTAMVGAPPNDAAGPSSSTAQQAPIVASSSCVADGASSSCADVASPSCSDVPTLPAPPLLSGALDPNFTATQGVQVYY